METNKKNEIRATRDERRFVADAVCPLCFSPLPGPSVISQDKDGEGRELRTFFGWCFKCCRGAAVIQFKRDDRWVIHKYRVYDLNPEKVAVVAGEEIQCCELEQDWSVMNELPAPVPVVLGPGGDFQKQITPEISGFIEKLKQMRKTFGNLCNEIDEWLK